MKTIFQVEIIRYLNLGSRRLFPKYTITQGYINFESQKEAETSIPRLAMHYDDVCCFIIRELPMGSVYPEQSGMTESVWLNNGRFHGRSCMSAIDIKAPFLGRNPDEIYYKKGDVVAVLNLPLRKVELATIIAPPLTIAEVARKKEEPGMQLTYFHDAYTVIYGRHDLTKLPEVELTRGNAYYPTNLVFDPKEI